jgi:hypothetical protein
MIQDNPNEEKRRAATGVGNTKRASEISLGKCERNFGEDKPKRKAK